jgi:hypothetical protein
MAADLAERITPVILTCARNLSYMQQFVESYEANVSELLPAPVIVADITASPMLPAAYVAMLARLRPRSVIIHTKPLELSDGDSVNHAAFFCLQQALLHQRSGETHVLFLEDDIIFSSQFAKGVYEANFTSDAAFYTFYQPHDGYGSEIISTEKIHNGYFYGTQCIMFPTWTVVELVNHQGEIEKTYPPGYDLRWSRFLNHRGLVAYTSEVSYVQHIGVNSRLGCMNHTSKRFIE